MIDAVDLKHGQLHDINTGWVGVMHLSNPEIDHQPPHVVLAVTTHDRQEREFTLRVGERFKAGDESWLLQGIDDVDSYDYTVRIVRVGSSTPSPGGELSPERREQLREKWAISSDGWEQAQERVRQEEQRQARELFGDRQPFAIPDTETEA